MKTIEQAAIEYALKECGSSIEMERDRVISERDFRAGAQFAQRWISVEDELPEIDIRVLYKNNVNYGVAFRVPSIDNTVNWNIFQYPDNQITHWRPIELE